MMRRDDDAGLPSPEELSGARLRDVAEDVVAGLGTLLSRWQQEVLLRAADQAGRYAEVRELLAARVLEVVRLEARLRGRG